MKTNLQCMLIDFYCFRKINSCIGCRKHILSGLDRNINLDQKPGLNRIRHGKFSRSNKINNFKITMNKSKLSSLVKRKDCSWRTMRVVFKIVNRLESTVEPALQGHFCFKYVVAEIEAFAKRVYLTNQGKLCKFL